MSALPSSPRTQISMHRLGITPDDFTVTPLQHLASFYPIELAQIHYEARKQFVSELQEQLNTEKQHVQREISPQEFIWAGEPDSLVQAVRGGREFVQKFKIEHEAAAKCEIDSKMQFVEAQEREFLQQKKQIFDQKNSRFEGSYNSVKQQQKDAHNDKYSTRRLHFTTTLNQAQTRKNDAKFDPEVLKKRLETAQNNQQQILREKIQQQRGVVQQILIHIENSLKLKSEEEAEFINKNLQKWTKLEANAMNAVKFKEEKNREIMEKLGQQQARNQQLIRENQGQKRLEMSQKVDRLQQKFDAEKKRKEEITQENIQQIEQKKLELTGLISSKLENFQEILKNRAERQNEVRNKQQEKEQKAEIEKERIMAEKRQELVNELIRKEKIKNQMRMARRKLEYEKELRSIDLVVGKEKFAKLDKIGSK